ncbi:MAG: DNA repair protein RadC [Candidatus Symbiothrix sp.]|jgi:DNA repair protein RadC|nr:DNA repair protein RadC [Candidatus Symbiothrix sp.]
MSKLSVKEWSPDDQPREKLLAKGVFALSDSELLAIILGSGNQEENVVGLAQRILQSADNLINNLGKYSVEQLMQFKGVGVAKAISIVAALELGKRRNAEDILQQEEIRSSRDIYRIFYPILCDLSYEEFWVLLLNPKLKIIDKVKISQGGIVQTSVDSRIIYKEALLRTATGVALCHNHPSGNAQPSKEDNKLTEHILQGLKQLDIHLHDHIIIGDGDYYSYADNDQL